jgi:hypothetical protein
MYPQESLEITTNIGCPINCKKYCPQEVIVRRYRERAQELNRPVHPMMSVEDFILYTETIPNKVRLSFGGFSEPFSSRDCIEMLEQATWAGFKIDLYTTLQGCDLKTIYRLVKLPLSYVLIHLPDGYGNAHIPITNEYQTVLMAALQNLPMAQTIQMNDRFPSNHREDWARNKTDMPKKRYPITCNSLEAPQRELLPNGDVFMCCCDMKLENYLGNLRADSYKNLEKPSVKEQCYCCGYSKFKPLYHLVKWYENHGIGF